MTESRERKVRVIVAENNILNDNRNSNVLHEMTSGICE